MSCRQGSYNVPSRYNVALHVSINVTIGEANNLKNITLQVTGTKFVPG